MSLWTADEAATATGGEARGDWHVNGVSIDTRTLAPGDLFVALSAARDGHEFVAQALEKGAGAALVSHVPDGLPEDAPLLIVDDVQAGLEALGRAGRARTGARVIAVTGSVGKTSTKEMLFEMLSDQGRTHASVASYNNHWGVPLTLARMPSNTKYAVIEIGMNHPGEIAPLARMARPHVAMITTVAAAHLEAFDSVEGIAREKAAILEGLETEGVAILNADIDTAAILAAKAAECGARAVSFGRKAQDFILGDVRISGDATVVQAQNRGDAILFKLNTPGKHFAMNALGALASCEALGADLALATLSLGRWQPYRGRGTRETIHLDAIEADLSIDLLDDAYNANPTSMAAALDVLAASPVRDGTGRVQIGRRIAFLGDMKELGEDAASLHAGLASLEAMDHIDCVHCIGPLMQNLHAALPENKRGAWAETSAEMEPGLRHRIDSGDVVLAKGSLSMKLSVIVDAIRKMGHAQPISDREE